MQNQCKSKKIQTGVDLETAEKIKQLAKEQGRTVSNMASILLKNAIDQLEAEK